jgi:hypothetical protein
MPSQLSAPMETSVFSHTFPWPLWSLSSQCLLFPHSYCTAFHPTPPHKWKIHCWGVIRARNPNSICLVKNQRVREGK